MSEVITELVWYPPEFPAQGGRYRQGNQLKVTFSTVLVRVLKQFIPMAEMV